MSIYNNSIFNSLKRAFEALWEGNEDPSIDGANSLEESKDKSFAPSFAARRDSGDASSTPSLEDTKSSWKVARKEGMECVKSVVQEIVGEPDKMHEREASPDYVRVSPTTQLTDKIFFHLHAHRFGRNNKSLEGSTPSMMYTYLKDYLGERKRRGLDLYGMTEELLYEINSAVGLHDDLFDLLKIQEKMGNGEKILMQGGWEGKPGHFTVFEIIPKNGKYVFRIYNLGAGGNEHNSATVGNKQKRSPYLDLEGIKKDKFTPHFFNLLRQLNKEEFSKGVYLFRAEYSEDDLYTGLVDYLQPSSIARGEIEEEGVKSVQESGICGWESWLAFFYTHLSKKCYKRFVCDIKLQSLEDYHDLELTNAIKEKLWHRNPNKITKYHLYSKAHQKFCGTLRKAHKNKVIGNKYFLNGASRLKKLRLSKELRESFAVRSEITHHFERKTRSLSKIKSESDLDKMLVGQVPLSGFHDHLVDQMQALTLNQLDRVCLLAKKGLDKCEYHSVEAALTAWLLKIGPPRTLKSKEEAILEITKLGDLARIYFEVCFRMPESGIVHPERVAAFAHLLTLQKHYSQLIHPTFATLQDWFDLKDHPIFLNFEEGPINQLYYSDLKDETRSSAHTGFTDDRNQTLILYATLPLQELFPELHRRLLQDPKYLKSEDGIRNKMLYISQDLPEWFKRYRDTYHLFTHLTHFFVANPTSKSFDTFFDYVLTSNGNLEVTLSNIKALKVEYGIGDSDPKPEPFLSTFRRIEKLDLVSILKNLENNEKSLLIKPNYTFLPDELVLEIKHIFISGKTRIQKGLEFFLKYPEKLRDTDYQTLFEIIFFRTTLLRSLLKKQPEFGTHISHFLNSQIEKCIEEGNIQTAVFLLRMGRLMSSHVIKSSPPFVIDPLKQLRALHNRAVGETERGAVWEEILSLISKKSTIDDQDMRDILVGSTYLKKHPLSAPFRCPKTHIEAERAFHVHSRYIEAALLKNQQVLNEVVYQHTGKKGFSWEVKREKGIFPTFHSTDGKLSYYPIEAILLIRDIELQLPSAILSHPSYLQLFSQPRLAIHLQEHLFLIQEKDGTKYYLQLTSHNELFIWQERSGKRYQFIPRTSLKDSPTEAYLYSRRLVQKYNHWLTLDGTPVIEIDTPESQNRLFIAEYTLKGGEISVHRIQNSQGQCLASPDCAYSDFLHMENPLYVETWTKGDALVPQKVELPRFNLSFTVSSEAIFPKYTLDQWGEEEPFYLSSDPGPSQLGLFSHYLLLKNGKGEKRVIIPKFWLYVRNDQPLPLRPNYQFNRRTEIDQLEDQTYYTFRVTNEGTLSHPQREANLYLAYILTLIGDYEPALQLLKKYGNKLTPFSENEKIVLNNFRYIEQGTGDMDPNGVYLRLYARYLLAKNQKDDGGIILELLDEDYTHYLNHYSLVTVGKLTKEEELLILTHNLDRTFDFVFYLRLRELDLKIAERAMKRESSSLTAIPLKINKSSDFYLEWKEDPKLPDLQYLPLTRLNSVVNYSNFLNFLEYAQSGTAEEKEWIKTAVQFCKRFDSKYLMILEAVLESPTHEWVDVNDPNATYLAAQSRLKNHETSYSKPKHVDIEPSSFRFEPLKAPISQKNPTLYLVGNAHFVDQAQSCFSLKPDTENQGESFGEWLSSEVSKSEHDPLYKKEIQRLQNDLVVYQQSERPPKFVLTNENGVKLQTVLKTNKEKSEKRIKDLEETLLAKANKLPDPNRQPLQLAHRELSREGSEKVIEVEEILLHFGYGESETLAQRNPYLTPEDIREIFVMANEYLLLRTQEQQRERSLAKLKEIEESDGDTREDLVQELGGFVTAKRADYDKPLYLLFEYYCDILLRQDQIKLVEQFIKDGNINPVVEMIMGSGKSKVIWPLIALLRPRGYIVVPNPLLNTITEDTQRILQPFVKIQVLKFDRNTLFTMGHLTSIYDQVTSSGAQVTSGKSILCFILKYLEMTVVSQKTGGLSFTGELELMRKILKSLSREGRPLLEEADTLLNVLKQVSFSVGDQVSPEPDDITILRIIYDLLYHDPEIKNKMKVESDPDPVFSAPPISQTLYQQEVFPLLVDKFIEKMKSCALTASKKSKTVSAFFTKFESHPHLRSYLLRTEGLEMESQNFYNAQTGEIQDILALAGQFFTTFLPHTLTKNTDEGYGVDQQSLSSIAIPFAAANTPSRGSQFAIPYISMAYTYQYFMKRGVTFPILKSEIQRLQGEAIKELDADAKKGSYKDTKAYIHFQNLIGDLELPLFKLSDAQIFMILEGINGDQKKKTYFITSIVLPAFQPFSQIISANPHHLVAFFESCIVAFTGTLWNGKSMHTTLAPQPQQGTESKTLSILFEKSCYEVYTIKEIAPSHFFQDLKRQNIKFDLVVDTGGYLKEGGNLHVAKKFGELTGKSVVFFHENQLSELTGEKVGSLSESTQPLVKKGTFLDQIHTVGSDVKQKGNAIGVVTIGRDLLLRDLLQSVWRLRRLDRAQRVKFIIAEDVQKIIYEFLNKEKNEPLTLHDIVKFAVKNQIKQQGKDNFKALQEELASISQVFLLVLSLGDLHPDEREKVDKLLPEFWVKQKVKRPRVLYGNIPIKLKTDFCVAQLVKKSEEEIDRLFSALPFLERKGYKKQDFLEQISKIAGQFEGHLFDEMFMNDADDNDLTVDQEQKVDTDTDQELAVVQEEEKKPAQLGQVLGVLKEEISWDQLFKSRPQGPILGLNEYFLHKDPSMAKAFDGISLAINVLNWENYLTPQGVGLFGRYRTPIHFVETQFEGSSNLIILSEPEGQEAVSGQSKGLYNLGYGYSDRNRKVPAGILKRIVKIKYLNGESSYTKEEVKILEEWFIKEGPVKMHEFFIKKVLAGFPLKVEAYATSPLKALFTQLFKKPL